MKRVVKRIFIVMMVALALSAISCSRQKTNKELPPAHAKIVEAYNKGMEESKKSTAAVVNGVNITMYDLVKEMNEIGPKYIRPGQTKDPQTDKKVKNEALDRLIYRELAVQEAIRQGMQPPSGAVDDRLKKFKAALKTEDSYREKLKSFGMTEEDLKKQVSRNILVDMITEKEIFDKVKIDPNLVKKTYSKEKTSYKTPSGAPMSFEEARPYIEEKLMRPLVQKREDEWVEGLKKAARIEITLDKSAKDIHRVN